MGSRIWISHKAQDSKPPLFTFLWLWIRTKEEFFVEGNPVLSGSDLREPGPVMTRRSRGPQGGGNTESEDKKADKGKNPFISWPSLWLHTRSPRFLSRLFPSRPPNASTLARIIHVFELSHDEVLKESAIRGKEGMPPPVFQPTGLFPSDGVPKSPLQGYRFPRAAPNHPRRVGRASRPALFMISSHLSAAFAPRARSFGPSGDFNLQGPQAVDCRLKSPSRTKICSSDRLHKVLLGLCIHLTRSHE